MSCNARSVATGWPTLLSVCALAIVLGVAIFALNSQQRSITAYEPTYRERGGQLLEAVFIGATFCGALDKDGFREAVEQMKLLLAERAAAKGANFAVTGVALDWSVEDGVKFLHSFGEFDEIVAGRNWLNSAAVRYMWDAIPGDAVVPQVIVTQRSVTVGREIISVGDERLLARKLGATEIMRWVEQGAPITMMTSE